MTMRRLAQQLEPFLHSVQRVPFVDLLVAAAFAIPTWLLAAVGGLATVYFAAGGRGDWSTTALLLAALAAGAAVAAAVTALTFIWMLGLEIWRQWQRPESDIATPASARTSRHRPMTAIFQAKPKPKARSRRELKRHLCL